MCTYTCMYIYIYTRTCIKVPPDVYRMLLDIYQDSGQARYLIVCVCVCVCACVRVCIHRYIDGTCWSSTAARHILAYL